MNVLLDTHAFLWWITDSSRLSQVARRTLAAGSNQLFWSAASAWEVGIKFALGRLPLPGPPEGYLERHLDLNGVSRLPIVEVHGYRAAALPPHHADPFDRMLVAQAQVEDLSILSADRAIRPYDVEVVW
jgi:PIN domain nuclease of toxin-antitoxin system